jgi:hypothetical protein
VAIYDAHEGALLAQPAPIGRGVDALAWGPDGELLVVSLHDGAVVALDARTLSPVWSIELLYACAAAVSRSGTLLALGAWERGMVASRTGAASVAADETPADEDDPPSDTAAHTEHERWIADYVQVEANERVVHLEKVASRQNGALRHEIWDVQCESSRWWAITEPLAAYDVVDHPDHYAALAFHLQGCAAEIADQQRANNDN